MGVNIVEVFATTASTSSDPASSDPAFSTFVHQCQDIHPACSIGCGLVQLVNHFFLDKIVFWNRIGVLSLKYAVDNPPALACNTGIIGMAGLKIV